MISLKGSRGQGHQLRGAQYFMKNAKKTVILVLCLAVFYAVVRKTYRFLFHNESAYFSSPTTPAQPQLVVASTKPQAEPVLTYNYHRLLKLVEVSENLKKRFYEQYNGDRPKRKPIDIKATKVLLSDLYREKVRLDKYIHELKLHFKGNIPLKKKNMLIYHQKVIEKCSQEIAEILRKV